MVATGGQHLPYVYAYDSLHRVVVVSCGDVYTKSCFAGVDTVQAQGRSVVEREQAVVELVLATKFAENVGPLNMHRACFRFSRSACMSIRNKSQKIMLEFSCCTFVSTPHNYAAVIYAALSRKV